MTTEARRNPVGPDKRPDGTPACETGDLIIIHNLFRRLYAEAPQLVRAVPDGSAERTRVVADHVDDLSRALHIHHTGEDEVLWDRLEQRAPACALHVGQMREQHARIAELLDRLDGEVAAWRGGATAANGEVVAATLDEIRGSLFSHLGQEEEDIAPVAAVTLTQEEWNLMGEHGMAQIPKDKLLMQLGAILDGLDPEERKHFLKNVPAPARLLWVLLGKRKYAQAQRQLYADITPA